MTQIFLSGTTKLGVEEFDYSFETNSSKRIAVVGPNGSGKTTLLRLIAGHERLRSGLLKINGNVYDEPTSGNFTPPHQRKLTLQHQDGSIFPHLTVEDNVAFPYRSKKKSKRKARALAHKTLEAFDLLQIKDKYPNHLSGGQIARVSLARSLTKQPRLLMLDEPTAALDVASVRQVHQTLESLKTSLLLVSHDPIEVLKLSDTIIALEGNKIIQFGTLKSVTSKPATQWLSKFFDLNLVSGTASGLEFKTGCGEIFHLPQNYSGNVEVSFPSSAISLHLSPPSGSFRNKWKATVTSLDKQDKLVRIKLAGAFDCYATITVPTFNELEIALGNTIWASIKATELNVLQKPNPAKT